MRYRNEELHESLRAYVSAVLQTLQQLLENKTLKIVVTTEDIWAKQDDGTFVRQSQKMPLWAATIWDAEKVLKELTEYQKCINLLHTDEVIKKHLNTLVGTPLFQYRITEDDIMNGIIIRLLSKQYNFSFDEGIFEYEYLKIEEALYSETVSCEMIALLPGFTTEVFPIQLDEGTSIDILTDNEVIECLKHGIVTAQPMMTGALAKPPKFAIRIRYSSQKVYGEKSEEIGREAIAEESNIREHLLYVIHALRVFKAGQCYSSAIIRYSCNWFFESGLNWFPISSMPPEWFIKYSLDTVEAANLQAFWSALQNRNVKDRKFLDVALRRFSYANERNRPEDQIIDLMIAAEALFLSDSGDAKERGELRFRLAIRAGLFTEGNNITKKEVYRHMRKAYDIRSAIAHGGKPDLPANIKSLEEFVKQTSEYLRSALHKTIDLAAQSKLPKDSLADWDSLIFLE